MLFSTTRTAEEKKAILSNEFHIEINEEVRQEVTNVCNLSAGIYEKGIRAGKKSGKLENEASVRLMTRSKGSTTMTMYVIMGGE